MRILLFCHGGRSKCGTSVGARSDFRFQGANGNKQETVEEEEEESGGDGAAER